MELNAGLTKVLDITVVDSVEKLKFTKENRLAYIEAI